MSEARESTVERMLRTRIQSIGGFTIKLAPTERGVPDRLVIMPGGAMHLVELKTTAGRLSPIQSHWHGKVRDIGVEVYTLYGPNEVAQWVRDRCDEGFTKSRRARVTRRQREVI